MKTGLFFGSFNPIHNGHLIIAQHMMNTGLFDRIRFVVSPQNPFKNNSDLWDEHLRFKLVQLAIADNTDFEVSDAEFHLPKPSYTIQTLQHFCRIEPDSEFSILIGSDNLSRLSEWKDIDAILQTCDIHVYARQGSDTELPLPNGRFHFYTDTPYLDISATFIRQELQQQKSVKYMVPEEVLKELKLV